MKTLYCWRCKVEVPMLDEDEWEEVSAAISGGTLAVKSYREHHGTPLEETPVERMFRPALDAYERITGFRETNHNALFHHRLALYGPPCHACARPLRTPRANWCGSCMDPRKVESPNSPVG